MKYFKQYFYCSIIFLVISHLSFSQRWDTVGAKFQWSNAVRVLYADTLDTYLYAAGAYNEIGGKHIQGIARWNGATWDSLGFGIDGLNYYTGNSYPNDTWAITRYNGKLYVGGAFNSLGQINAYSIGTWDGIAWDSVPIQPFNANTALNAVWALSTINGNLYMGGNFDSVDGQPCIGIAKWDGTAWSNMNFPNLKNFSTIDAICAYKGSIYAGGNFCNTSTNDSSRSIMRCDSAGWHIVGGGIRGSFSCVNTMVVYNNELYVGGYFLKSEGDTGNYIQRWDGTKWSEVGGGMGGINGQVFQLAVYKNKLYAVGVFTSAGNIPAEYIALWDGTTWCSLGSTFDNTIGAACVYKDSLYIGGGFWTINGDSISYLAEWTGGNYTANCSTLSVPEVANAKPDVTVYPNPSNGVFNIELSVVSGKSSVEIYNMLGEKVYTASLNPSEGGTSVTTVSIPNGVAGIYLYRIISETGQLIGEGKVIVE